MKAVFNSSPFIFLADLNLVEEGLDLFTDVTVPFYVHEEILRKKDKASEKLRILLKSNKVKVVHAKNIRMIEAFSRKLGGVMGDVRAQSA